MTLSFLAIIALLGTIGATDDDSKGPSLERQRFRVDGRPGFVILPAKTTPGKAHPWVLYAPTLGEGLPNARDEGFLMRRFLDAGIAIAGVDVGESYGNPKGRATFDAFHAYVVEKYRFDSKACLLCRSRGGLMVYCWAVEHPEKVRCIAGIYPVCSIASYPGVARAAGAYGLPEEKLAAELSRHDPIPRLGPLAKARVPIFHIHGDVDRTVPIEANSGALAKRYAELGGAMRLVIPRGQGHNMWRGFFENEAMADFVVRHATGSGRLPRPVAHWKLDDKGDVARDAVGEHHGKIVGATKARGKLGSSLLFDRPKGHRVEVPYSETLSLSTFTVSAWVYLEREPTFSGIVGTRFGGEQTFDMKVNAAKVHGDIGNGKSWIETKVNFYADDVGKDGQGGDLALRRWYHIAFVIDTGSHECRLWLDGDLKKRIPFEGTPRLMQPGQTLRIGNSSTDEFMDGRIDDVRIWDRALSDAQVRTLFETR
jgi:hypothetical protein